MNVQKSLKTQLASLSSTLTTSELRVSIQDLETEKESISLRLQSLREGKVKPTTVAEANAVEAELRKWELIEKKRRTIELDLWAMIADSLPEGMNAAELRVRAQKRRPNIASIMCYACNAQS
jgi:26S proteasome regulatory subunit, ATPase 3, interacting protein